MIETASQRGRAEGHVISGGDSACAGRGVLWRSFRGEEGAKETVQDGYEGGAESQCYPPSIGGENSGFHGLREANHIFSPT